jgi:hypothetical protein
MSVLEMRLIKGGCHCGNIKFELGWPANNSEIPARACTCTFCVKHGGVWTSNPAGTLTIRFADAKQVSEYAFGTRTATFHVCRQCGVVPVVTSNIEGRTHAVVSVNALEDVDPATLRRAPISFDGEGVGDRLARRQRNWIADVRFT